MQNFLSISPDPAGAEEAVTTPATASIHQAAMPMKAAPIHRGVALKRLAASVTASSVLLVSVAGCATASKDVPVQSVSPLTYSTFDCDQLRTEGSRLQARAGELGGRLDEAAANDKAITGVGVVLFWPALFFLGGTKQQEAEFGRVRGELAAIEQAATAKRCGMAPQVTPASVGNALAPSANVRLTTP